MYIDTHAHLTCDALAPDLDGIMTRALSAGVETTVVICTDEKSLLLAIDAAEKYPSLKIVAATTPHDVEKEGEYFFPIVEKYAIKEKKLIAVGESGLDYFYADLNREVQTQFLIRYFNLAKRADLPLVIHCRDAFEDLFTLADQYYLGGRAILHCFTGNLSEAMRVVERGWYISFSGIVTFKKSDELRAVAKEMPLDRILIETDAPYLAPGKWRGKVNEPAYISETARVLAELKNVSLEEMATLTKQNALTCFSL